MSHITDRLHQHEDIIHNQLDSVLADFMKETNEPVDTLLRLVASIMTLEGHYFNAMYALARRCENKDIADNVVALRSLCNKMVAEVVDDVFFSSRKGN